MKSHPVSNFKGSPNQIATIIGRYRASGLGLKAFALEEGLPPGRLHYWVYQRPSRPWGRRPGKPSQAAVPPVFQEVKLPCGPERSCIWAAEVGVPGGVAVRFSASASAEWIGAVVQALQRPC